MVSTNIGIDDHCSTAHAHEVLLLEYMIDCRGEGMSLPVGNLSDQIPEPQVYCIHILYVVPVEVVGLPDCPGPS